VDTSPAAVTQRLWPLLVAVHDALLAGMAVSAAVHATHGWNPAADRHLDHQLVRREAMEHLRPWDAGPEESAAEIMGLDVVDRAGYRGLGLPVGWTDPRYGRQLALPEANAEGLGLPMSGLIMRTPTDVVRVWHSDDGELPSADTPGLRAFYRQGPGQQTQLSIDGPAATDPDRCHLALLWADSRDAVTRLDLVRPYGHVGRRPQVDWHVDVLGALAHRVAPASRTATLGSPR
jgi:hypothetical protein